MSPTFASHVAIGRRPDDRRPSGRTRNAPDGDSNRASQDFRQTSRRIGPIGLASATGRPLRQLTPRTTGHLPRRMAHPHGNRSVSAWPSLDTSPRREGNRRAPSNTAPWNSFNPRPRREGDLRRARHQRGLHRFNPRPRREGDGEILLGQLDDDQFQSTPSQGGRHLKPAGGFSLRPVSIHALAGRATSDPAHWIVDVSVSIHALAGRATRRPLSRPRGHRSRFNPRPRREGDSWKVWLTGRPSLVSIHALAGRATPRLLITLPPGYTFQSTPSQGGRPSPRPAKVSRSRRFNPRPRREGDVGAVRRRARVHWSFNPRPRREGDCLCLTVQTSKAISKRCANLRGCQLRDGGWVEQGRCKAQETNEKESLRTCPLRRDRLGFADQKISGPS